MPNDSRILLMNRANRLLYDLDRALSRLDEALKQNENDFVRDAAIQRFEFCFELAWKSTQAVARLEGQDCASPRAAFSTARRNEWVSEEPALLDMIDDRNKTSHTYREAMAKEVFENLPRHLPHLRQLHQALVTRVREIEIQNLQPPSNQ